VKIEMWRGKHGLSQGEGVTPGGASRGGTLISRGWDAIHGEVCGGQKKPEEGVGGGQSATGSGRLALTLLIL